MHATRVLEKGKDSTREHERNFNLHLKKLEEIRGRSVQPASPATVALRSSLSRLKALSYFEAERIETIKRDNRLLMRKLVAIAEGKGDRGQGKNSGLRSLNVTVRKREDDRIRLENEAFSKRLLEKEGLISKKQLDLSFSHTQQYRRQISKASMIRSKLQKTGGKVPPLTESDTEAKSPRQDSKVRRSTNSYTRGPEFSPLGRKLHQNEARRPSEQPLDTAGEIAVITDGKHLKRRSKPSIDKSEDSQRVLGKPQRYIPPLQTEKIDRKGSLSTGRQTLGDRKEGVIEEEKGENEKEAGNIRWANSQKPVIRPLQKQKGPAEPSGESRKKQPERKPTPPKKPAEVEKAKKPVAKPVEKTAAQQKQDTPAAVSEAAVVPQIPPKKEEESAPVAPKAEASVVPVEKPEDPVLQEAAKEPPALVEKQESDSPALQERQSPAVAEVPAVTEAQVSKPIEVKEVSEPVEVQSKPIESAEEPPETDSKPANVEQAEAVVPVQAAADVPSALESVQSPPEKEAEEPIMPPAVASENTDKLAAAPETDQKPAENAQPQEAVSPPAGEPTVPAD